MPKDFGERILCVVAMVAVSAPLLVLLLFLVLWVCMSPICALLGFGREGALDRAIRAADAGNIAEAVSWCDEAIRRDPRYGPSYELRAEFHEQQGDYRGAVEDYSSLIHLEPDNPEHYFDCGRAYEALGDEGKALSDYCDAILSGSKSTYSIQDWAERRAGRSGPDTVDELIELFKKAVARHPKDSRLQEAVRELRQAETRSW